MISKSNVPYYMAGTLATFTLLASGVFAAAPYIGFLAPVAALSVGLPFIIGGAVFSVVTIALSAVVIQKNGAIRRQDALLGEEAKKNTLTLELQKKEAEISDMQKQLANQAKEIEGKDTRLTDEKSKVEAKEKENSEQKTQLAKKEGKVQAQKQTISELKAKIQAQEQTISGQNDHLTKKEAKMQVQQQKNSELEGQVTNLRQTIDSQAKRIDEEDQDVRRMRCELAAIKRSSVEQRFTSNVGVQTQECKDSDVHMPPAKSARNWIPSLKTIGGVGAAGLRGVFTTNGGFGAAGNPSNAVVNPVNSIGSHISIANSLSTFHRPTDQQIMQIQIDEAAEKLASAEEFAKNNFGIPNNYSEPQWYKDLHKSEDPEEIMKDVPSLLCEGSNSSDYQFAKPNVTHTEVRKIVGSNQTSAIRHSSVDKSGTYPANYETSLAKRNTDDTCSIVKRIWNKLPSISSLNPFGSRKAVESNQAALATMHSSVDTSGTCPVDSYTALAEYNSSGTCPSQGVCPNEREHFNIADSNIASSNYQFTKQNANEQTCTGASNETGLDQTTIPKEEGKRCDIPNNQFFSRVDNGINTSKQQGTFVDSAELKKLTEAHPLVYSAAKH